MSMYTEGKLFMLQIHSITKHNIITFKQSIMEVFIQKHA